MHTLANRLVVITGGASGIGRELGHQFAWRGARVAVTDRDRPGAEATAEALRKTGIDARAYAMDVTSESDVAAARAAITADMGPTDILVNNAGVVFGGAFLDVPLASHVKTVRVNVEGVMIVTHAWLADLIGRPEAHIVNIASASSFVGLPFGASYGASKWAVLGLTESLRLELKHLGHRHVGTTAICPSYVATGMFDGAQAPRLTSTLTPERVAALTVRAVLTGRQEVLTPWLVRLTPLLRGVLPRPVFDAVAAAFGVNTSMLSWRGRV